MQDAMRSVFDVWPVVRNVHVDDTKFNVQIGWAEEGSSKESARIIGDAKPEVFS